MAGTILDLASASLTDLSDLSQLHPHLAKHLLSHPEQRIPRPIDHLRVREKEHAKDLVIASALPSLQPNLEEVSLEISMRDGHTHPLLVTRPTSSTTTKSPKPLIVLFHPGGFFSGSAHSNAPFASLLSHAFSAVVAQPAVCLAPENPFPAGALDAWDALRWIAAHASTLDADPTAGFLLAGNSSGGNLVAVLAELAKTTPLDPPLTGLWALVPVLFGPDGQAVPEQWAAHVHSWEENKDAPVLQRDLARTLLDWYQPQYGSALWSPFNAEKPFEGLPQTFVQVCGADLVRDDGMVWARVLVEKDVDVRCIVYKGLPHAFWRAYPGLEEVCSGFWEDVVNGVGWLLGGETADARDVVDAFHGSE